MPHLRSAFSRTKTSLFCALIWSVALGANASAQPSDDQRLQNFKTQAWNFSQHHALANANMDAVRASGAGCVLLEHREIAFVAAAEADHLGAAWVGDDCGSGFGAVAITLYPRPSSPTAFGGRVIIDGRGGEFMTLWGPGPYDDQIRDGLRRLISGDPFRASRLPVWRAGEFAPAFPTGLVFEAGAEREIYEAIRARDGGVWCFQQHQYSLACFAEAPGRANAVEVLRVFGLGPYGVDSVAEAIRVVAGETPPMSAVEYCAAEEAFIRGQLAAVNVIFDTSCGD